MPGGGWEQDDEEAGEEDAGKEEEEGLAPHGYSRHHQLHSAARQHRTPSSRRHHHAASRTHQSGKIPQMMGGKKNTGWQTKYIKTRGKRSWGTEWISYWWGGFNHCLLFTVSNCAARVRRGCGAGLSCPSHWTRAPRPRGSRLGLCSGQTTFDPYTSLSVLRSRPPFGGSGSSSPHFGGSGYCYKSNKFWGKKYNNNKKLYYLYSFH